MDRILGAFIARSLKPVVKLRNTMVSNSVSASKNSNASNYEPTLQDVLSVKECFLKLVPIELVDQIIDFAEYWPHNAVELAFETTVQNDGEKLYLQSQPLPGTFIPEGETEGIEIGGGCVRTLAPGRKIVFRIWSHDQGWCDDNRAQDIYEGSFTWFEAFLERPLSIPVAREATAMHMGATPGISPNDLPEPRWKTVAISKESPEEMRWHVQSNVRASYETKKHTVVWSWDRNGPQSANGAGYGGDFVRSMKAGDRVSVVAKARYPGWANYVEKMAIDIYYAV